jgi:plastocyanin
MISKLNRGGGIFPFFLSLFFNSCVRPEDNAINQPEKNSSSIASEKIGPEVYSIEISNMKFNPAEITVQKGDTVIWKIMIWLHIV